MPSTNCYSAATWTSPPSRSPPSAGDLDTYGFQILGRLRAALPDVRSVLMDVATLTAYRGLAVPEPVPFRGAIGYLTAEEHRALAMLRTGDLRLEQERLPADAIRQALMSV